MKLIVYHRGEGPFGKIKEKYREYLRRRYDSYNRSGKTSGMNWLATYAMFKGIKDLKEIDLEDFKKFLRERIPSEETIKGIMGTAKAFLKWVKEQNLEV